MVSLFLFFHHYIIFFSKNLEGKRKRLGQSPSLSIVFGLSSKTQWLSGLYYADFIIFTALLIRCGGGTTKSNSNELPISSHLSECTFTDYDSDFFSASFFHNLDDYSFVFSTVFRNRFNTNISIAGHDGFELFFTWMFQVIIGNSIFDIVLDGTTEWAGPHFLDRIPDRPIFL